MNRNDLPCLLKILFPFFFLLISFSVKSQGFMITETLRDSKASSFTFGGRRLNPDVKSYLTSGIDDPEGDGWLRLTNDDQDQAGSAIVNQSFSSKLGVLLDLEFKTWRNKNASYYRGADGFSIFLYDASVATFQIGGFGGSLGYAPHVDEGLLGLSGGFVGIGVDEYGNYSNNNEGRTGGVGLIPNSVGVRGPATRNYEWLGGNTGLTLFSLQYEKGAVASRPIDSEYFRRIRIEINPRKDTVAGFYTITVSMQHVLDGPFVTLLKQINLPAHAPDSLKLGFAASTGSDVNFHEVRNLLITTPGGVRIVKKVDKLVASVGDELTYTLELFNQTDTAAVGFKLNDPLSQLPPEFQVEKVTFYGDSKNTAFGYSDTDLSDVSVSMEPFSMAIFKIKGRITGVPAGKTITNTAVFNVGTSGIFDPDTSNDTATVTTTIRPRDLFIPNVFTPNGDPTNEFFEIVGLDAYPNSRLIIYNRWGNEVYRNNDYQNNWNGDGLNEGTYYYTLYLKSDTTEKVYRGWVLLKRR